MSMPGGGDAVPAGRRLDQFHRGQGAKDFQRNDLGAGGRRRGEQKHDRERGPLETD